LNETAKLLKARGHRELLQAFFDALNATRAVTIEWTNAERFAAVQEFYQKHLGKSWSFTDCLSFRLMRERGLTETLAKNVHFKQAGLVPLLM
jgi:predicted nucleic acid-binding protein